MLEGGGLIDLTARRRAALFTDPQSLSFQDLNVHNGRRSGRSPSTRHGRRRRRRHVAGRARAAGASAGATLDLPSTVTVAPGGEAALRRGRARRRRGGRRRRLRLHRPAARRRSRADPVRVLRRAAGPRAITPKKLVTFQTGDTRKGESRVSSYRWPAAPVRAAAELHRPADGRERRGAALRHRARPAGVNFGVAVIVRAAAR